MTTHSSISFRDHAYAKWVGMVRGVKIGVTWFPCTVIPAPVGLDHNIIAVTDADGGYHEVRAMDTCEASFIAGNNAAKGNAARTSLGWV